MKPTKSQIVIIGIVLLIVFLGVLVFLGVIPGLRGEGTNQDKLTGTLTIWGVFDDSTAIQSSLINSFKLKHPNVTINFRELDPRSYEADLVNALAAGTGPDVFYVHNTWLPKHYNKLDPRDPKEFTVVNFADLYPQVVVNDFVRDGAVYAMPLYIDTLALIYNQDLLDAAGIAKPPKTWEEFAALIPQLRKIDQAGRLTQAAGAIGGSSKNINEANALLYQLWLQNGVDMTNEQGTSATFDGSGLTPLNYYLSFANPNSPNFTWDPGYHYSIDAFAEESVAMIFNYGYQLQQLKEKNPFLKIGVSPMLQFAQAPRPITYADYFGLGVSATSANKELAWLFVNDATIDPTANATYLNAVKRSPALRSLIASSTNDPEVGIFAKQALTATSWYQTDGPAIAKVFDEMLDSIVTGRLSASRALDEAENKVSEIMRKALTQ